MLFVLFIFLTDLILGLLSFPSEIPIQVANPANFTEIRKSYNEFEYTFKTNSQGLRYPDISLEKQDPDEIRVLVLGDSFVEGVGVEADETFHAKLEKTYRDKLNKPVYFINAGLRGTGPVQQANLLNNIGMKYHPDKVLLCVYANDLTNMPDKTNYIFHPYQKTQRDGAAKIVGMFFPRILTLCEKLNKIKKAKKYYSKKQDVVAQVSAKAIEMGIEKARIEEWKKSLPPELVEAANNFEFNGAILSFGLLHKNYWQRSLNIDNPVSEEKWLGMESTLNFIQTLCTNNSIELTIVYIPAAFQYNPEFQSKDSIRVQMGMHIDSKWLTEDSDFQNHLAKWCNEKTVPFIDLTDTFRKATDKNPLNYRLDSHWTEKGHELAAEVLFGKLNQLHFVQSK